MNDFQNAVAQSAAQSGLSLAGGIISTGIGAAISHHFWKKQYQQQRADALADREHLEARQDELIEQQQAPAQVERLKEAGLNPALAYGGNSATPAPVVNNTTPNPSPGSSFSSLPVDMLGFLKQAQDNSLREREIKVAERQMNVNESVAEFDKRLKEAERIEHLSNSKLIDAKEAGQMLDNLFQGMSFEDRLASVKANLEQTQQNIVNLGLQGTMLQAEIDSCPLKIEKMQAEIQSIRENTKLSRVQQEQMIQSIVESQSRVLLNDSERAYKESKRQIDEALGKHEISRAEYNDKMKKVDKAFEYVGDIIGSVTNVAAIVGGAGLLKGAISGKGKTTSIYDSSRSYDY